MKNYKTILVEKKPPVGKIIYNQPGKRNPWSMEMVEEATEAFLDFEKDDEVRVIILTHTGPFFNSGLPVTDFIGKSAEEILQILQKVTAYNTLIQRDISKPVIALADGPGAPQAADFIILSDRAKYSHPAINIGLICGAIGSGAIDVGFRRNRRMCLTGDYISAKQALEWGFVDEVVPHEQLEEVGMEWARKLAQKSPVALKISKKAFWITRDMTVAEAMPYIDEIFCRHASSEAGQRALKAFAEGKKQKSGK